MGTPDERKHSGLRGQLRRALHVTLGKADLDPRTELNRLQRFAVTNLRVIFQLFRLEVYRRVELHAQALTMKTLLALVPFFVVLFAITSVFDGGMGSANREITEFLLSHLAGTRDLEATLSTYLANAQLQEAKLGAASIVILVFTVMSLLSHVENSINTLFGVRAARSLRMRLLSYWALLTLGPLLLGASLALTAALQTSAFGALGGVKVFLRAAPLVVAWLGFGILYIGVPNTRVRFAPATLAAIVAGSLWTAAKSGFAYYAKHNVTVQDLYGSLAAFPMFILWLYISWLLILWGARLCYAFQHAATYTPHAGAESISQHALERATCRFFLRVATDFCHGAPPTVPDTAAAELGIPAGMLPMVLELLHDGEFVRDADHGLVPARDLASITVEQLLAHLRRAGHDALVLTKDDDRLRLDELFGRLEAERSRIAGAVTFRDLAASVHKR